MVEIIYELREIVEKYPTMKLNALKQMSNDLGINYGQKGKLILRPLRRPVE